MQRKSIKHIETQAGETSPSPVHDVLDRYLAGDLSKAELAAARDAALENTELAEMLDSARRFESLMTETLVRAGNGAMCTPRGVSADSGRHALPGLSNGVDDGVREAVSQLDHGDLSVVDLYLAGMMSRDDAREAVSRDGAGHALESEWLEALCYERLLKDALRDMSGKRRGATFSGADQIDRYLAGDLDVAEQAELFAHSADDSQLLPALNEARACESVLRESLRRIADGAAFTLPAEDVDAVPALTVLDDLIDRSLAGALKQSELPQLESAAEASPAARARILAAERFAQLLQDSLQRMASGAEAMDLAGAPTSVGGRVIQLPNNRQRAAQRRLALEHARRKQASVRRLSAAAVVVFVGGLAGVMVWLSSGGGSANPSEPGEGGVPTIIAKTGESGVATVSGAPKATGSSNSNTTNDSAATAGNPRDGADKPVVMDEKPPLVSDKGDATAVMTPGADAYPSKPEEVVLPSHGPSESPSEVVLPRSGEGSSADTREGGGVSTDEPAVSMVAIDLSNDQLDMRVEALDSARRSLMELRRDDGLFSLWAQPDQPATADDGRAARRAARLSYDASVVNAASMQATVMRALAMSAGNDLAEIESLAPGMESLAKLVKQKQEYSLLTVRDAAGYLTALEAWHSALASAGKARKLSPVCSTSATEAVRHLVSKQRKSGLWGEPTPERAYGKPDDQGTWSALVGRQVDADLLTTSAAIRALDAATKLEIREKQGNAHQRALTAVLNLQSPHGEKVESPVLKWDEAHGGMLPTGEVTRATARGWTLIGDTIDAAQKPILRSGAATAAAMHVIQAARERLPASERTKRFMATLDASVADGMAWLSANFTSVGNPVGTDDGAVAAVTADYGGAWMVALRDLAPMMPGAKTGGNLMLGGTPWFVELNRALLPSLAGGEPQTMSGALDIGASLASRGRGGSALRIAMALIAIDPDGLKRPDGKPVR